MSEKVELLNRTAKHYAALDLEPMRKMITQLQKFLGDMSTKEEDIIAPTKARQRCCLCLAYLSYNFIALYTDYFGKQKKSTEEKVEGFEDTFEWITRFLKVGTETQSYVDHMVQARDWLVPLIKVSLKQHKEEAETDVVIGFHRLYPASLEDSLNEVISLNKLHRLMSELLNQDGEQDTEPFLSFTSRIFSFRCVALMNLCNNTLCHNHYEGPSLLEVDSSTSTSSSSNTNTLDEGKPVAPIPPSSVTPSATPSAIDAVNGSCFAAAPTPCLSSDKPAPNENRCSPKSRHNSSLILPLPSPSTTSQSLEKDEGAPPRFAPSEQQDTMLDCVESHQVENSPLSTSSNEEEKADLCTDDSNSEVSKVTRKPPNKAKTRKNSGVQSLPKTLTQLPATPIWNIVINKEPTNTTSPNHALEIVFFRHRYVLGLLMFFLQQHNGKIMSLDARWKSLIRKTHEMSVSRGIDAETKAQIQKLSKLLQNLLTENKNKHGEQSFALSLPSELARTGIACELVQKVLEGYIVPITSEIKEKQGALKAAVNTIEIKKLMKGYECNLKYASIVKEHFEFKFEHMNKNSPLIFVESTTTPAHQ